MQGHRTSD